MNQIIDIFSALKKATTREQKIAIVRENRNNLALATIWRMTYMKDSRPFTDTVPPYKRDDAPEGLSFTTLLYEAKSLYVIAGNYALPDARKQEILIRLLESLGKEADILEQVIRGRFDDLPCDIVEEALNLNAPKMPVA